VTSRDLRLSDPDLGDWSGHEVEPPPDLSAYANMVKRATRDLGCTLVFEPGRVIVGNVGILVTKGPIGTLAVSGAIKWQHPSRSRRFDREALSFRRLVRL
jgi:hypothetical protein